MASVSEMLLEEQKFNFDMETEIWLWEHGDKEDLCVSMLNETIRKNKLILLRAAKKASDKRLRQMKED